MSPAHAPFRFHLALAVLATVAITAAATADMVSVRRTATISGQDVRLADIAKLDGAIATELGDTVVRTLNAGQASAEVTLDAVRDALDDANVNWSRLSVAGFNTCKVTCRPAQVEQEPADDCDNSRSAATRPSRSWSIDQPATVRDELLRRIEAMNGVSQDQLRVTFARGDDELLALPPAEVRIETQSTNQLGRLVFAVWNDQPDQPTRRHTVTVKVAVVRQAVVAVRDISRGSTVSEDDVAVREMTIDQDRDLLLTVPAQAIGKTARSTIRQGTALADRQLVTPPAVDRGELVTITRRVGNLMVKMDALAGADGEIGDVISARNLRTKEDFIVRVTGRGHATLIGAPDMTEKATP